jgi:signal transduction histidine kinase
MRRAAPVLIAVGIVALLISYVAYTQRVVRQLRRDTTRSAEMYARIYSALSDTTEQATRSAMLDLSRLIREMGVPAVVTDPSGVVTAVQNLPFDAPQESERVAAYVAELDRENPPVVAEGVGTVHFGNTPVVRSLRIIPMLQAVVLGIAVIAGVAMLRARGRADRERMWAGMARESAHQLGTPLSSLNGWIELLSEETSGPAAMALPHMRGDLERLERVAHRFERIGRPPRKEPVDIGVLAERVANYFRARVPTLAHSVVIRFERRGEPLIVQGDGVLLEWALESLLKNAVDALAGRGGTIQVMAEPAPESGVRVQVADDGPGIPRDLQRRVFSPGFTTKEGGWGIGLSLARRIVEQTHGGELTLVTTSGPGATFEIILR